MGTNCAPLVAALFLFCYERDFMLSLSGNSQTDVVEAFNLDWLQSLKQLFINVSYHKTEPSELDWPQLYGMTH